MGVAPMPRRLDGSAEQRQAANARALEKRIEILERGNAAGVQRSDQGQASGAVSNINWAQSAAAGITDCTVTVNVPSPDSMVLIRALVKMRSGSTATFIHAMIYEPTDFPLSNQHDLGSVNDTADHIVATGYPDFNRNVNETNANSWGVITPYGINRVGGTDVGLLQPTVGDRTYSIYVYRSSGATNGTMTWANMWVAVI